MSIGLAVLFQSWRWACASRQHISQSSSTDTSNVTVPRPLLGLPPGISEDAVQPMIPYISCREARIFYVGISLHLTDPNA